MGKTKINERFVCRNFHRSSQIVLCKTRTGRSEQAFTTGWLGTRFILNLTMSNHAFKHSKTALTVLSFESLRRFIPAIDKLLIIPTR